MSASSCASQWLLQVWATGLSMTWDNAQAHCVSLGGNLPSVQSPEDEVRPIDARFVLKMVGDLFH